jgi:organic hydroperoxide reductase OsmC/OhrA
MTGEIVRRGGELAAIEEERMSEPPKQVDTRPSLFPHRYSVAAVAGVDGDVTLESERLPPLASAPPAQFDGPGDRWSPETLLVAAIADCFVLTFRAIARASKLPWLALRCDVEGVLDRVERVTQFTEFKTRASLRLPFGADDQRAARLLARAEETCLITNSLKGVHHLEVEIDIEGR